MWPFNKELSELCPPVVGHVHYIDRKGQTLMRFPYFRGCVIPGIGSEIYLPDFSGVIDHVVFVDPKIDRTEDWDFVKIVVGVYVKDTSINTDA
jgi:hypothetical protein